MDRVYRLGKVAQLVGLNPATIRQYEKDGEIKFQRDSAGVRVLSEQDIKRIKEIRLEREARRPGR